MIDSHPLRIKEEYEKRATELLRSGDLGHGTHEDLLIEAATWLDRPLSARGRSLADFFVAAIEHHVTLLFAVRLEQDDPLAAADLEAFVRVIVSWLRAIPLVLLQKSPTPLGVVVAHSGAGYKLGAQVMRPGGASLIYWDDFRKLKPPEMRGYRRLSDSIRQTIIHELIGHQLALCCSTGVLVPREDLRDILLAAGMEYLKPAHGPPVAVDRFLEAEDLWGAIRGLDYGISARQERRYYSSLPELIAFAADGQHLGDQAVYDQIRGILKRNLFRSPYPLTGVGKTGGTLYEGFDLADPAFARYYVERQDDSWVETRAICQQSAWLSETAVKACAKLHLCDLSAVAPESLDPGQTLLLKIANDGELVAIENVTFLASPFGLASVSPQGIFEHPAHSGTSDWSMIGDKDAKGLFEGFRIVNHRSSQLSFRVLKLGASRPVR